MKKPCRSCPNNKCKNCPVKEPSVDIIEYAALQSQANFGMPEKLIMEDPESGELVFIDMKNPTKEGLETLQRIMNWKTK